MALAPRYTAADCAAILSSPLAAAGRLQDTETPGGCPSVVSRLAGRGGIFGERRATRMAAAVDEVEGQRGSVGGTLGDARAFKRKWFL